MSKYERIAQLEFVLKLRDERRKRTRIAAVLITTGMAAMLWL